jgi:hypothetical protein
MTEKNDYYIPYYSPGQIDNHGDGKRFTTFAGDGHMRCWAWMQKVQLHPEIAEA